MDTFGIEIHIGHDDYLRKQQEKMTFLQITHQKSTACKLFPAMINPKSYRKINKSKHWYSLSRFSFRFLTPLFVGVMCLSVFCYAFLCVHSNFAFILERKRKLVALLLLSYNWLQ